MNRSLFSRLAPLAFAFVLAAGSAFAGGAPETKAPDTKAPAPKAADAAAVEIAQPFPNTWYGQFGTICSWIDTGDGVFLVDTGATAADAKKLRAEIARTTKDKPIRWIALTHLHSDSNDGFASFLPTDATIFVNARATGVLAGAIAAGKGKTPTVVGIGERIALVAGKQAFEIGVPSGNAHSAYDMYVFDTSTRTVYLGDLVTTGRCPMLSDPDSDLKGWLGVLERLDGLGAQGLVASRLDPTAAVSAEIGKTRRYLQSMLAFLMDKRKQNAPEARVTGELTSEKLGDYCPRELSALNALSVYRRILADGTTVPGSAAAALAPKK